MANLKLRYSLFSNKKSIDIKKLSAQLPQDAERLIDEPGTTRGKYVSKDYSIDYQYEMSGLTSVDETCQKFYQIWNPYQAIVKNMHDEGFESVLLFEFDLENSTFPELVYTNDFLTFLANIKVELQFFFYT